jgi:type III restriction enzyme
MALHKDFPDFPHAILDPEIRWFPADESLRGTSFEKLLPPLVPELRKQVKQWRDSGYDGATETSRSLLNWWFNTPHLLPQADGTMGEFQYYFAQREALEAIIYLYDRIGVKDKYDLMRFDRSGAVSTGTSDETWRRFVVKMATGAGKPKVMSLVLAWCYFHKLYEPGSDLARSFLVITPNIIVLERDGKVVSIPPEEIAIPSAKGDQPDRQKHEQLYVKEKNQTHRETKIPARQK